MARVQPGRRVGLLADEVEKVFPSWVHLDPSTDMKLVGPNGFEALVIEAMRQLADRIDTLEKENQRLQGLLDASAGRRRAGSQKDSDTALQKPRLRKSKASRRQMGS